MSVIRRNPVTRGWTIIAPERKDRPYDHPPAAADLTPLPEYDPSCPFCPGNESATFDELMALRAPESLPNTPGWEVRVVNNRYPALKSETQTECRTRGLLSQRDGWGRHEIIIESPRHNTVLGRVSSARTEKILSLYQARIADAAKTEGLVQAVIFRNQGRRGGTSLLHPHSQLMVLPLIPPDTEQKIEVATSFYQQEHRCLYCSWLEEEFKAGERIIAANDDFVALTPYAAGSPYETWILPRSHAAGWSDLPPVGLPALAQILHAVLRKLYLALDNPDYNLVFHAAPFALAAAPYYHFHVQITLSGSRAGFEIGSGIAINTHWPEADADFLRAAPYDDPAS